jgi:hypothetical protein
MSGKPILLHKQLTDTQRDCVDKLREALEQAEAGNISSIALVVCMKKGYATIVGGTQAADLNLGCDSLKRKILLEVEKPYSGILAS